MALGAGAANFKRALGEGLSEISKAVDRIQPALAVAKTRGAPADLEALRAAATLTVGTYSNSPPSSLF